MFMSDVELRDPEYVERWIPLMRNVVRRYFRSEVRGLDKLPDGGALLVSNHSGGYFAMDVPVFATDLFESFGPGRPFYVLAHDVIFQGPIAEPLKRAGIIPASRDNAHDALTKGGAVMVFPGGDYDVFRPANRANTIDFGGRTGYVRTALEAGVPIVPSVSIGGQESQLFLSRGQWLAEKIGLKKLTRSEVIPITVGIPFGLSVMLPLNLPLPTKIVAEVLEPIDVAAQFGPDPDPREVDEYVRSVMQTALNALAQRRRLPIIG